MSKNDIKMQNENKSQTFLSKELFLLAEKSEYNDKADKTLIFLKLFISIIYFTLCLQIAFNLFNVDQTKRLNLLIGLKISLFMTFMAILFFGILFIFYKYKLYSLNHV